MGTTDTSDFDQFFRLVFPRAVAVAERITNDRHTAEDAALDAFAKAHLRWGRIGQEPWREAWTCRVAVNEALRRLPKARPSAEAKFVRDPADEVVLRQTLTEALRRLPKRQREVVVLSYWLGFEECEVANALGVSRGTVKTHLHRAIATLRNTVGASLKEEHLVRLN